MISGVPQGSVLGPLLFLLHVNGAVFSPRSRITLYADDILLIKHATTERCKLFVTVVSQQISNLQPRKSKLMIVTGKRNTRHSPALFLNGQAFARVFHNTYLGVNLTSNLSWSKHVHEICTRAKKMLGLLYRTFYLHTLSKKLMQLYTSPIRPCLEYACEVWNPFLKTC